MEGFMSAKSKSRSAWGAGRAAFAALSPEIFGELTREIPMSVVYRKYKDRLGISYSQSPGMSALSKLGITFKSGQRQLFGAFRLLAAERPNRL